MPSYEIPKQNPFSLYDFIGYFIPGAIFVFLILVFDTEDLDNCEICMFIEKIAVACGNSPLQGITSILFFFTVSYVMGQIISILSNIIIEESKFCNFHNYLYYILLKAKNLEQIPEGKCNFFSFLLIYVPVYEKIFETLGARRLQHRDALDKIRRHSIRSCVKKIFKSVFYLPSPIKENNIFDFDPKNPDANYFELLYHFVIEKDAGHLYKIQNYVALYGFMRNMSMVFCLLSWITVVFIFLNWAGFVGNFSHPVLIYLSLFLYSFFGFITMIGLHKYKKRFTMEVLLAASVLSQRISRKCKIVAKKKTR